MLPFYLSGTYSLLLWSRLLAFLPTLACDLTDYHTLVNSFSFDARL